MTSTNRLGLAASLAALRAFADPPATLAQQPPPATHYVGRAACHEMMLFTLSVAANGAARLSYRSGDVDQHVEVIEGKLGTGAVGFAFPAGETIRLKGAFSADRATMTATWHNAGGEPEVDCGKAEFARLALSPEKHMEALITRLGEVAPSLDHAKEVAALSIGRPDLIGLPDLQAASLMAKHESARAGFWQRFWKLEQARILAMPAAAPADLKALDERVATLAAPAMGLEYVAVRVPAIFTPGDFKDSGSFLLWATGLIADRKAALGQKPLPLTFGGGGDPCTRIHWSGTIVEIKALEMIFAFPADYWDEGALASMRASLARCHPTAPEIVKDRYTQAIGVLDGEAKEIEARTQGRAWLLAERLRMLALPLTVATLRATLDYELARDDVQARRIGATEVARFFEPGMASRRSEALAAAKREIEAAFVAAVPGQPSEDAAAALCESGPTMTLGLNEHCRSTIASYVARVVGRVASEAKARIKAAPRTLAGLKANKGFRLDRSMLPASRFDLLEGLERITHEFDKEIGPIRAEAIAAATKEILEAYIALDTNNPAAMR
ncbi:MAG TPA: hypothetical protein PK264_17750, partial [Hyphomicrobiaceae bacterium]|nr:hypothetical protein [Hyphomicrobiaceae bacterium]